MASESPADDGGIVGDLIIGGAGAATGDLRGAAAGERGNQAGRGGGVGDAHVAQGDHARAVIDECAGDVGSGHSVTAIYEVTPAGAPRIVDDLRYGPAAKTQAAAPAQPAAPADPARRRAETAPPQANELGFLKLRYKLPKEETSRLLTLPITPALEVSAIDRAPEDVRFSIAVAARGSASGSRVCASAGP